MLRCVVEGLVPDVSKDRSAFDLRVKQKKSALTKALRSSETSGITSPATRRNIPEASIFQISFSSLSPLQSCEHLKKPNLQRDWLRGRRLDSCFLEGQYADLSGITCRRQWKSPRQPIPEHVDKLSPLCIKMSFFTSSFGRWHDFSRVSRKTAGD